jgi:transposase
MMIVPAGVKVHLALGYTDMRKGMDGLAMLVQSTLKKDPFCGHLFAFRGKRAQIGKIPFWDGNGLCLSPRGATGAASCGRDWSSLGERSR